MCHKLITNQRMMVIQSADLLEILLLLYMQRVNLCSQKVKGKSREVNISQLISVSRPGL